MKLVMNESENTSQADPRHFLDIHSINPEALRQIVDLAHAMKKSGRNQLPRNTRKLDAYTTLAMVFEKPSTRTRISFDVAMRQLGGETLVLNAGDMQLGRGETVADTAKVLSRFVDAIMLRCNRHEDLLELAEHASIPVINGLTDLSHPCQILADIMTLEENLGPVKGRTVAWIGDGNNVATSWIHAALQFDFTLKLACPPELPPSAELISDISERGGDIIVTEDPTKAVKGCDCVVTDTWVSMGDADADEKRGILAPYQVDGKLMKQAAKKAIFLHCLPAHRGEEVTAEVIDGPQSVVFDEAENRMHAQKAVLAWCLNAI